MVKKNYDLVCSLGGNCSAAHNLLYRNKRYFSLPFDWLYMENETPIFRLAECFKNDFKNFCLKKNLKYVEKSTAHFDKKQYFDSYTEYYFLNHFDETIEEGGYEEVKEKLNRRIRRLYDHINIGKNILFLLSTDFEIKNLDGIYELQKTLNEKFKNKNFCFEIINFNCQKDEMIEKQNITIRKYMRKINLYDFTQTNFEWAFLDDIEIDQKEKIEKTSKKLFTISLFNYRLKLTLEKND